MLEDVLRGTDHLNRLRFNLRPPCNGCLKALREPDQRSGVKRRQSGRCFS